MPQEARELYGREPRTVVRGVPVFIDPADLARVDEYVDGNPYHDENSTWDRFRREVIAREARGPFVLDLGCGEGDLTSDLAGRLASVAAADLSLTAVERNRERNPAVRFCVADACDLPYADGLFDSVVCANLFEHVESPPALLTGVRRVLMPGGRLVFSTPSRYRTVNFRRVARGKAVEFNSPHHVTEYTNGQVEEFLRRYGFVLIGVRSNLRCRTLAGTLAAYAMQGTARLIGSHLKVGDPTIYVAHRT
ncbi:MAG: class I SAM-dependent methyltransferase [Planctomycetes bacterium]|nr:class I SAM-dependent methyltransferase [Planctomycetota bacterium]